MYTNLPQRKTVRLKDYDYSQEGYYFVTICTQNREDLFGQIVGADSISARSGILLSSAGNMVENIYSDLTNLYKNIVFHEYVVMPNHFHGIIQIKRADMESAPTDLPTIIQTFKRHTTVEYIKGVKNNIYPPFNKQIWQRGYYEHIIRNELELQKIRKYVQDNPVNWQADKYYK